MRMTGEQRREQLLDATKSIAGADGFHAISIEAVARRAGITRPIVYGHFDDLGGLLAHVGGLLADVLHAAGGGVLRRPDPLDHGLVCRHRAPLGGLCRPLDALGHRSKVLRIAAPVIRYGRVARLDRLEPWPPAPTWTT